jgi:hypothetical protein
MALPYIGEKKYVYIGRKEGRGDLEVVGVGGPAGLPDEGAEAPLEVAATQHP